MWEREENPKITSRAAQGKSDNQVEEVKLIDKANDDGEVLAPNVGELSLLLINKLGASDGLVEETEGV